MGGVLFFSKHLPTKFPLCSKHQPGVCLFSTHPPTKSSKFSFCSLTNQICLGGPLLLTTSVSLFQLTRPPHSRFWEGGASLVSEKDPEENSTDTSAAVASKACAKCASASRRLMDARRQLISHWASSGPRNPAARGGIFGSRRWVFWAAKGTKRTWAKARPPLSGADLLAGRLLSTTVGEPAVKRFTLPSSGQGPVLFESQSKPGDNKVYPEPCQEL